MIMQEVPFISANITIIVCLLINILLFFKEGRGRSERWNQIIVNPLNMAFSLLLVGYTGLNSLFLILDFSLEYYKLFIDILMAVIVLSYLIMMLNERKRHNQERNGR
ncbi:hypothetical protein PUW24_11640 [Paenibacillus urinalis]|uniref:Uncharacterized protein n=2 Tax=Paenibacillus TaxID=44249 RepID=A0ABY7XEG5_9BACL|nr:hypothetical protein [Paenibacillus urinalis]WDH99483.1 hypothetical protein PUW24_11640 [Paenibacillus urinalis]WDI03116.1 hypothetical protein PUW25_03785 [Paenibacillus urinalis]